MGLFAEKGDGRARAERAGIDVVGALAVGHMVDGGASVYLLVFPDRLELVSTGQMGFRTGAGRSVIPLGDVSAVAVRDGLFRGILLVGVGANTIEFSTGKAVAGHLCRVIEERLAAGPVQNPLLRNLAELHAAGLLTDAEYEAKRAGLL